jgi:hypothetical protein
MNVAGCQNASLMSEHAGGIKSAESTACTACDILDGRGSEVAAAIRAGLYAAVQRVAGEE